MDQTTIISELASNKTVFESLLIGLAKAQQIWKPAHEKWCQLEVICHLYDEEREDFRARVKHCLENADYPFSPIDPVGWVTERKYLEQDFDQKLASFLQERDNSIQWLESLENTRWENSFDHPSLGKMTANLFLSNWLAHDYIHIRQIVKIKYAYLLQNSGLDLSYAGDW